VRDVARDTVLGRVVHVVTERAVSLEVAHRSQPGFEPTMMGCD
jgi:hypothetical protein